MTPILYATTDYGKVTEEQIRMMLRILPDDYKKHVETYKAPKTKVASTIAYFLLCYGLTKAQKVSIKDVTFPALNFMEKGKPFLVDSPYFFNISHSTSSVACGISTEEIGVDVQDIPKKYELVIKKAMSKKEQELVTTDKHPHECFTRLWTLKECLCKYNGLGLSAPFASYDFYDEIAITPSPSFFVKDGLSFCIEEYGHGYMSACTKTDVPILISKSIEEYLADIL